MSSKTATAKELTEQLGVAIIEYIRKKDVKDVIVYQTEFFGYEGDNPTLEIVIPNTGAVVFGNVTIEEGLKIVDKYVLNTKDIIEFMIDNNGTKKCNHNH